MSKLMTPQQTLDALEKWKVDFHEYPGWKTRTRPGDDGTRVGLIIHHTGSDIQSDSYLDFLFKEGRASEGIPGPLCNVATDMDGDLHIGAWGRANHAGRGAANTLAHVKAEDYDGYKVELKPDPDAIDGNAEYYGNEVRYDGSPGMKAAQYRTALLHAAAICDFHRWTALSVIGHREHTRRKSDPGNCPMNKFRSDLREVLKEGPKGQLPPKTPIGSKPNNLEDLMAMELDDVVIASAAGKPAVTVRGVLAKMNWLADEHAVGGKFERLHAAFANGGDLNNQLDRIEADTDDGGAAPKA